MPKLLSNKLLPIVLANWKMNLSVAESVALAKVLVRSLGKSKLKYELVLCPTYPALSAVGAVIKGSGIGLGAQDVFWKSMGPYTGEVSPSVLREMDVNYVLVGHSERRQYLKETESMIHQKLLAALNEGLTPVLCVGETFAERQSGQTDVVLARQVTSALQGAVLSVERTLIVAYEPVWVIGSGQAVGQVEAIHASKVIYQSLLEVLPSEQVATQVRIIYGGSVNSHNITVFTCGNNLNGVLVGGASLEFNQFGALLKQLL